MIRHIIKIEGIVQGVGFRPFVSTLAKSLEIKGFVKNIGSSVYIDAQGETDNIMLFEKKLIDNTPTLASISSVEIKEETVADFQSFDVLESEFSDESVQLPSDVGMCADCRKELFDKNSRRYLYPFTVCSHCGPRYTLIEGVPYDREKTSMKAFEMCDLCKNEYYDITNRRYRCEPISCPNCGPSLILIDRQGAVIADENQEVIKKARLLLKDGYILAIKGIGGFHLACDAFNCKAVNELRKRKKRDKKPFAVMARDVNIVEHYCNANLFECELITSPEKPIVILEKKNDDDLNEISSNTKNLGVMLPYTPLHKLLFDYPDELDFTNMLVMTSANISGEPICIKNDEAQDKLSEIADYILMHDREILLRADDSLVREFDDDKITLRRARGYVPKPIIIDLKALGIDSANQIFAAGSDLKNTFCLTKNNSLYLSSYIGDLEDYTTFELYKDTIKKYSAMLGIRNNISACDMHPSYHSSKYAKSMGRDIVQVQHHHAHIAACMAENSLTGQTIGVAFDGTGYGTDGSVWGGEFLVCGYDDFDRGGHLKTVKMFGGDSVSSEPWKSALGYIYDAFDNATEVCKSLNLSDDINIQTGILALEKNINCHKTSSCGRLFDAISAICNIKKINEYEAQSAIELEYIADENCKQEYQINIIDDNGFYIDTKSLVEMICWDVLSGVKSSIISAKFHNTMARSILLGCERIRTDTKLDRVCLGGGVFQNMILMKNTVELLRANDFKVFWNKELPINDGSVALGQAIVALYKLGKEVS